MSSSAIESSPIPAIDGDGAPHPIDNLSPVSVLKPDARIKSHYRRLVLISHCQHLAALDPADTDSLVVSTDWLAWRRWVDRGGHGVHFESVMADWPSDAEPPDEVYLRSADWMFDRSGDDLTMFHGVSLGAQFFSEVARFTRAVERLHHALDRLMTKHQPQEVHLIDIQVEDHLLDASIKTSLIEKLAAKHEIHLTTNLSPPSSDDPLWPEPALSSIDPVDVSLRGRLRTAYTVTVDLLFRLTTPHLRGRPRIFLMTNWNAVEPLIEAFAGHRMVLVLIAAHCPKTPRFIWQCWRRGIVLAHVDNARLTDREEREIEAMPDRVEAAWDRGETEMEAHRRAFVKERIFDGGWLREPAPTVKQFERLWRRHRFSRAIVGDAGNALNRLVAETAKRWDTPVDEIPNGLFLADQKLDVRTGSKFTSPLLQRVLAHGEHLEDWVGATGAPIETVRVGYPALDAVRAEPETEVRLGPNSRILVLGEWVDGYDTYGLHSTKLSYTVEVLRFLTAAGFKNIRIKIHPNAPNLPYYQEAMRDHGLDWPLYQEGAVNPHVDWAEAVIGPVSSGSFVETLATGKSYFALRHYPSMMPRCYTDRLQTFDTPKELVDALASGWRPNRDAILEYLCAFREFPNASRRFWQVIAASVGAGTETGEKLQGSPA